MQYVIIDKNLSKIVVGKSPTGRVLFSNLADFSENGCINITLFNHYEAREFILENNLVDSYYITLKDYYTDPKYLLNA